MIGLPLNDHGCLGHITELLAEMVQRNERVLVELAAAHGNTESLAGWIRSLPQRDDLGAKSDGPRVTECEPSQRLRIPAPDPNCVERAALFIAVAELIDPLPVRQMATIETPKGLHTIAIENGAPVILDPQLTRNAMEAGLFQLDKGPVQMSPAEAIDWIASIAAEPARQFRHGRERVRHGCGALHGVLGGKAMKVHELPDVAFVFALGEREAQKFGGRGIAIARCTIKALSALDANLGRCVPARRNAIAFPIGGYRFEPDLHMLGSLAKVAGRLGTRAGVAALRSKLADLGVNGMVLREVEHELNREGLTLGAMAKPAPMPGTLAALSPDALVGRWLASRIG